MTKSSEVVRVKSKSVPPKVNESKRKTSGTAPKKLAPQLEAVTDTGKSDSERVVKDKVADQGTKSSEVVRVKSKSVPPKVNESKRKASGTAPKKLAPQLEAVTDTQQPQLEAVTDTQQSGLETNLSDRFSIYAFTLPQALNPSDNPRSSKLVKVGITTRDLSTRLKEYKELKTFCDESEQNYLCGPQCLEMLISAEISAGRKVNDSDIEVCNTEAVVRSMLGHPPTLAYVGRKAKRQIAGEMAYDTLYKDQSLWKDLDIKFDPERHLTARGVANTDFQKEIKRIPKVKQYIDRKILQIIRTNGLIPLLKKGLKTCGFTEWVVCSHQKIEALKRDIKTDKIVSKEKGEVHESCTAFLMRLKLLFGSDIIFE